MLLGWYSQLEWDKAYTMCARQDMHRNIVIEELKDKYLRRRVLVTVYHAHKNDSLRLWKF